MKIQTILEIIDTKVAKHDSKSSYSIRGVETVNDRIKNPKLKSGLYGSVSNTQDPHIVSKTNHKAEEYDGYSMYMEWLIENKIYESNPCAPRIYSYKKVTDKNGKFRYVVKMEKLTHLTELDHETSYALLKRMFPRFMKGYKPKDMKNIGNTSSEFNWDLTDALEGGEKSTDKNYNKLIDGIRKNIWKYDLDLHVDNVMVRLSPYPQLVVTDPLT